MEKQELFIYLLMNRGGLRVSAKISVKAVILEQSAYLMKQLFILVKVN
jgi:hypothetical protein